MRRWIALTPALFAVSCGDAKEDEPPAPVLATDIFAALGEPLPSATAEQKATFDRGKKVAQHRFTPEEGLGPEYNVSFCGACHEQPTVGGSAPRYRNFLLTAKTLPDGSQVPLGRGGVQTTYNLEGPLRTPSDGEATTVATRNAIPFFGAGLIAEIPESSILANADADDADGDGISGRPNYDRGFVGRFGRKAQTVSLEGFIRGPFFNHLGVTSDPLPNARKALLPVPSDAGPDALDQRGMNLASRGFSQAAAPAEPVTDDDGVPDPELAEDDLFDLVSFAMLLAAPQPEELTGDAIRGRELMDEFNCTGCHTATLAGPRGLIPAWTDLLLHDMGGNDQDDLSQGVATGSEFRTAPLWGIIATSPYLHDGRADTLHDAIVEHGGESSRARDAYLAASAADQGALIAFLESLGGRAQTSTGLLPPDAPIPAVGQDGGPWRALSDEEQSMFRAGREVFDRDFTPATGLGPKFNGDSCRACHFDLVTGGSGPLDLNVVRQGILADGAVTAPDAGTLLHRFQNGDARPEPAAGVNFFELRQPPATFGLGLIDLIDEASILAQADPDDADGDGIRGRAHVRPDGRLGRLGWKGGVPGSEEFMRDAMSNEVGITMPVRDGVSLGFTEDADDVADPELTDTDYDAITFYLALLSPPAPVSEDSAAEQRGKDLFAQVGCDGCHTPALPTGEGMMVPLYSDLLLHATLPEGAAGIPDGAAGESDFRTPPLWGVRGTGPYMHDGFATTLDDAIRAHDGEAAASRDAYEDLADAQRADLVGFLNSL